MGSEPMPKQRAEEIDEQAIRSLLRSQRGLSHIRVRRRADVLNLESGPAGDPIPHARLRRETVHLWRLELPTASGRWDSTPHRGLRDDLLRLLAAQYPWMLAKI